MLWKKTLSLKAKNFSFLSWWFRLFFLFSLPYRFLSIWNTSSVVCLLRYELRHV